MTEAERQEIQAKIDALPVGGITMKTINGKRYPYLQWTENGKQRGRRVREDELEALRAGIEEESHIHTSVMKRMPFPAAGRPCRQFSEETVPPPARRGRHRAKSAPQHGI